MGEEKRNSSPWKCLCLLDLPAVTPSPQPAGRVVVANIIYQTFLDVHFNASTATLVFLILFNLVFGITGRK